MLEPAEISVLMRTSRWTLEAVLRERGTWSVLLGSTVRRAKAKIAELEQTVKEVKDDDKRFAFLKKIKVAADPEFNSLIDEYICKRKAIGLALTKPVTECRAFIYTGDTQKKVASAERKQESSGSGFFSGWGIGSVFGMGDVQIPGTKEEKKTPTADSEEADLGTIAAAEIGTAPETISGLLSKMAARIRTFQPERASMWLNQLQLCLGTLFRATLQFYTEAKNVEKLKNFLIDRLDILKEKLKESKAQVEQLSKQLENLDEVKEGISKKMRLLDSQNLLLNTEKIGYEKTIFVFSSARNRANS